MKIRSWNLAATLLLAGTLFALAIPPAHTQTLNTKQRLPKRVVANYTSGSKYLNPPYDVAQIPFHKLTHINHASVPWASDGTLSVATGFLEPDLITKAHAAGVKVLLLTGGDFAAVEGSSALLDTVIANLLAFVTTNGYDGLDVDWEFPSTTADRKFFVELMTKLRAAFPSPRYTLSIRCCSLESCLLRPVSPETIAGLLQPHGL